MRNAFLRPALLACLLAATAETACRDRVSLHWKEVPAPIRFVPLVPDTFGAVRTIRWSISTDVGMVVGSAASISGAPPSIQVPAIGLLTSGTFVGLDSNGVLRAEGELSAAIAAVSSASEPVVFHLFDTFQAFSDSMGPPLTRDLAFATSDGAVVLLGGQLGTTPSGAVERFDPNTGSVQKIATLAYARTEFGSARLPDGRFLIAGGTGSFGADRSGEIWDPVSQTTEVFSSAFARSRPYRPNVVVVPDGRVLIMDGLNSFADAPADVRLPNATMGTSLTMFKGTLDQTPFTWPYFQSAVSTWYFVRWGVFWTVYADDQVGPIQTSTAAAISFSRTMVADRSRPVVWDEDLLQDSFGLASLDDTSPTGTVKIDLPAEVPDRTAPGLLVIDDDHLLVTGGFGTSSVLSDVLTYEFSSGTWTPPSQPDGSPQTLAVGRSLTHPLLTSDGVLVIVGGQHLDNSTALPRFEARWPSP